MKKLILLSILFIVGCASISSVPLEERHSEIVIENLNKGKDELYDITLEWMAKVFNNSKSVIEVKDKDRGKIIGKGYWIVKGFGHSGVSFTLTFSIKENKIRGQFENYQCPANEKWAIDKSKLKAIELMEDLKTYINKDNNDDNW